MLWWVKLILDITLHYSRKDNVLEEVHYYKSVMWMMPIAAVIEATIEIESTLSD